MARTSWMVRRGRLKLNMVARGVPWLWLAMECGVADEGMSVCCLLKDQKSGKISCQRM